jgi:hypothetical protein
MEFASPLRPTSELVRMIDPPLFATRCGSATFAVYHTPLRLMSMVSCQPSSSSSRAGCIW